MEKGQILMYGTGSEVSTALSEKRHSFNVAFSSKHIMEMTSLEIRLKYDVLNWRPVMLSRVQRGFHDGL